MSDRRSLIGCISADGDPVHAPTFVVIGDGIVLQCAIVPDNEHVGPPTDAADKLGPGRVCVEEFQERGRFCLCKAI